MKHAAVVISFIWPAQQLLHFAVKVAHACGYFDITLSAKSLNEMVMERRLFSNKYLKFQSGIFEF